MLVINEEWSSLYSRIIDGGQFCFITVSPKPNKDLSYKDVLSIWFAEFRQLSKVTEHLIVSCELTSKAQLHFHLMIRLWPIKNKYTFIKCFVNRWFHTSILLALYGKQPTEGLPYLFKSTEETEGVTELPSAVLNMKMLQESTFKTALEEFWIEDN